MRYVQASIVYSPGKVQSSKGHAIFCRDFFYIMLLHDGMIAICPWRISARGPTISCELPRPVHATIGPTTSLYLCGIYTSEMVAICRLWLIYFTAYFWHLSSLSILLLVCTVALRLGLVSNLFWSCMPFRFWALGISSLTLLGEVVEKVCIAHNSFPLVVQHLDFAIVLHNGAVAPCSSRVESLT